MVNLGLKISSNKHSWDWITLMQVYKSIVNEKSIVLEIGASSLERTVELSEFCCKLTGVEIRPDRIRRNFNNVEYILGDWQNLTSVIPNNSIDILVSSHVIEHIKDDLLAINETYRVLKKGGVALLTTPNRDRIVRIIIEIIMGKRKFPYWEHEREYNEQDLFNLLNKSCFKQFKITPIVLGIHGGHLFIYFKKANSHLRKYSNFFLIELYR